MAYNWHKRQQDGLTTGDKAADTMRNTMGSWKFVFGFLAFMAVWAVTNLTHLRFDPYPFILLNLILSTLAGLQGAILLIAAKRADAVAAALAKHDYEINELAEKEISVNNSLTTEIDTDIKSIRAMLLQLIEEVRDAKGVSTEDAPAGGSDARPKADGQGQG